MTGWDSLHNTNTAQSLNILESKFEMKPASKISDKSEIYFQILKYEYG